MASLFGNSSSQKTAVGTNKKISGELEQKTTLKEEKVHKTDNETKEEKKKRKKAEEEKAKELKAKAKKAIEMDKNKTLRSSRSSNVEASPSKQSSPELIEMLVYNVLGKIREKDRLARRLQFHDTVPLVNLIRKTINSNPKYTQNFELLVEDVMRER